MAAKAPKAHSASPSPSVEPNATRVRTRKAGEIRSRSGCLTCKQRRKKCDEDFRLRANGAMACTRCADRHIDCEMAGATSFAASQPRHSPYPTVASPTKAAHRGVGSASALQLSSSQHATDSSASIGATLDPTLPWNTSQYSALQQPQHATFHHGQSVPHPEAWLSQGLAAMRYNRPNVWQMPTTAAPVSYDTSSLAVPASTHSAHAAPDMAALYNFVNGNSAVAPLPASSQWNQTYPSSVDNMMLDDFVNELMSLTGPMVGTERISTAPSVDTTPIAQSVATSPSNSRPRSDRAPAAQSVSERPFHSPSHDTGLHRASSAARQRPLRSSQQYQKLLASDAIESLLSKYSPIYEQFWHATLLMLSERRRQAAVDYLMGVIRSNKACRASVVVVCLAYHELVQRARKQVQTHSSDIHSSTQPANWTTLASESFEKHQPPLPDQATLAHPIMSMFPDSLDEQSKHPESDEEDTLETSSKMRNNTTKGAAYSGKHSRDSSDKAGSAARNLSGKLANFEKDGYGTDNDPSKHAPKSAKVQDLAVELWFDIAQAELERSRDDLTLEQEICAIINLRWACLCFAGAERTRQLTEELGRVIHRSGIDLEHMVEEENKGSLISIMLQTAVYTDILDAACERGKRASVPLRNEASRLSHSLLVSRRKQSAVDGGGDNAPFFGRISLLSLELLTCFKMISDLAADVWAVDGMERNTARPTSDEIATRSRELEGKIMSLPAWSDPHTSSSLRVRAFALQEIWRQTARLYMLQSVHRRGQLHPELQAILHEIIRLAKMIKIQSFPPQLPAATVTHYAQPLSTSGAKSVNHAPPDYVGGLRTAADPYATTTSYAPDAHSDRTYPFSTPHARGDTTTDTDPRREDRRRGAATDSEHTSPTPPPPSAPSTSSAPPHPSTGTTGPPPIHPFQMWLDVASWEMCTVWFLCSTVAVTSADRQFCIHHLDSLGLERANRDNVQVIRDFWAKQDETGHSLDWFDFVKSSGRCVVFAF